jgi:hypothetical protein
LAPIENAKVNDKAVHLHCNYRRVVPNRYKTGQKMSTFLHCLKMHTNRRSFDHRRRCFQNRPFSAQHLQLQSRHEVPLLIQDFHRQALERGNCSETRSLSSLLTTLKNRLFIRHHRVVACLQIHSKRWIVSTQGRG